MTETQAMSEVEMPQSQDVAEVARKLTKAALRAIPKLSEDWTLCSGRLRVDSYGLWWGKLYPLGLVERPRWPQGGACAAGLYEMRLTPLGLAVRTHLLKDQPNV